jgi:hypothetical protein
MGGSGSIGHLTLVRPVIEISSMVFPQHDEVFYFYGLALHTSLSPDVLLFIIADA